MEVCEEGSVGCQWWNRGVKGESMILGPTEEDRQLEGSDGLSVIVRRARMDGGLGMVCRVRSAARVADGRGVSVLPSRSWTRTKM